MISNVLVLGATGFVGSAAVDALVRRGAAVRVAHAPRLPAITAHDVQRLIEDVRLGEDVLDALRWSDCVVNAAGRADAGSGSEGELIAANAAMPALIARAALRMDVQRLVHISTAAVQGARGVLDASSELAPFSPYSRSKAMAEQLLSNLDWDGIAVYRPQGVHGRGRPVTEALIRFARSPFASVAGQGQDPAPQALIENVGDAIAAIALSRSPLPKVISHPWEGVTTGDLLTYLGGKPPRNVPTGLASATVALATVCGRRSPRVATYARRLQTMWFGQRIARSWLTDAMDWRPIAQVDRWVELGARVDP